MAHQFYNLGIEQNNSTNGKISMLKENFSLKTARDNYANNLNKLNQNDFLINHSHLNHLHHQQQQQQNSHLANGTPTKKNFNSLFTKDIEKELTDLTLSIEREMEKQSYYTPCFKCTKPILDRNEACQAMGNIYHGHCFTCISCGRSLKGKSFYYINNHVYCEEDYLYSGFLENAEKCCVCGHIIVDMILQAIGKSYHPGCFRCYNCNECLDGLPFTLDIHNHIYCIKDYYKKYAPKCTKCKQAITPVEGSTETVRVVSMEKDYHVDCFACEECDAELSDEPKKRCYPLGNKLLCLDCHVKNIEVDNFAKILIENTNPDAAVVVDKKKS